MLFTDACVLVALLNVKEFNANEYFCPSVIVSATGLPVILGVGDPEVVSLNNVVTAVGIHCSTKRACIRQRQRRFIFSTYLFMEIIISILFWETFGHLQSMLAFLLIHE